MSRDKELEKLRRRHDGELIERKRREDYGLEMQALGDAVGLLTEWTDEERRAFYEEGLLELRIRYGMVSEFEMTEQTGLVLAGDNGGGETKENSMPKVLQATKFIKEGTLVTREDERSIIRLDDLLFQLVSNEEINRFPCEIGDIQDYLLYETNARLPRELVKKLNLKGLKWEFVYPKERQNRNLCALFLGGSRLKDGEVDYDDALGVIYARRMIDNRKNRDLGKVTKILDVSVAGIDQNAAKVVAVAYNCFGQKNLGRFDVSVEELEHLSEYQKYKQKYLAEAIMPHHAVESIPTNVTSPEVTAGLITKAMVSSVCEDGRTRVLRLLKEQCWLQTSMIYAGSFDRYELEQRGYYVRSGLNSFSVGFKPRDIADSNLRAWKVSVPKNLESINGIVGLKNVFRK